MDFNVLQHLMEDIQNQISNAISLSKKKSPKLKNNHSLDENSRKREIHNWQTFCSCLITLGYRLSSFYWLLYETCKCQDVNRCDFLKLCQIVQNSLDHIDQGKRFSDKDPHCNGVKVKLHRSEKPWHMGYSEVSFDEFTNTNRKVCVFKNYYKNSAVLPVVEAYHNIFHQFYQFFTKFKRLRKDIGHNVFDSVISLPSLTNNYPTVPTWFTSEKWGIFIKLVQGNELSEDARVQLKEPVKEVNKPKECTSQNNVRTVAATTNPMKRRRIIRKNCDSDLDSDDSEINILSTNAKRVSEDAPQQPVKSEETDNLMDGSSSEDIDTLKRQLFDKMRQITRLPNSNRIRALSVKVSSVETYGIEYPTELEGVDNCHLRLFYVIGGEELVRMSIRAGVCSKDVTKIKEVLENHCPKDYRVFQIHKTHHLVLLTPQLLIDDNMAYPVNNWFMVQHILQSQEGNDPSGNETTYPSIVSQFPMMSAKNNKLDYKIEPTISDLAEMDLEELKCVKDFKVIRNNIGMVEFQDTVDVTCIDLLETVTIKKLHVSVKHLNGNASVGDKLNCPARITFYKARNISDQVDEFIERFKEDIADSQMSFISYDSATNVLVVDVPHFSEYDINDREGRGKEGVRG